MQGDEATSAFAGDPQPVEVYHRGIWYLGELLGWRHQSDGRCLARVRCVVDGLRHSAWKDLGDLRLPEPLGYEGPDAGRVDESDDTRPHVLLADQRTRPRPPVHALVPPPRWQPPAAEPQPATAGAVETDATTGPDAAAATPVPPSRRGEGGDWAHLRRGGRLSRV